MATHKVTIYTRVDRQDRPAKPKTIYPAGTIFFLRYRRAGKRVRQTLPGGSSYQQAVLEAKSQELELFERDSANYTTSSRGITRLKEAPAWKEPDPAPEPAHPVVCPQTLMLDQAIDKHLDNAAKKSGKTSSAYSFTLSQFYRSCGNQPLKKVNQQDLVNFVAYLRETGVGNRTIYNRISEVGAMLRASGAKQVSALIKGAQVRYTEKIVRSYRPDELKALFAAATPEEWITYQFFLCTGARESEVMHAIWPQVDFVDKIFKIDGDKSKDKQDKEVPIPNYLVVALKTRMLNSTGDLLFPTPAGKPNGHLLRNLQALAKRAGVKGAGLHVFRKTWATQMHRSGLDARSIQKMLGHSDLKTTISYLQHEDARSERSRAAANATFGVYA